MKELSIEEKAKRYDEALIRGSKLWESDMITRENYEYIFPEVKESENIKIIKAIKYGLDHVFTNNTTIFEVTKKQCLAWLEAQGEHSNFLSKIQVGDKVTRNEDGVLVNLSQLNRVAKKQGEQKPVVNDNAKEMFIKALERVEEQNNKGYKLTDCDKNSWWEDFKAYTSCTIEQKPAAWSDEDEKQARQIERIVHDDGCTQKLQKQIADWLKSIKERVQPKQEWSEEDEYCRHQLIVFCENCMVQDAGAKRCAHWLKSLRPQNWKPSEGQLECLGNAIDKAEKDYPTSD